ncbi:nucleic acid binding, OB-fold, tRNA/helicase-type [Citrifermentans bremense]|uniref:Nucleic acid binding, OB-fold, tRNA/helicase-type n=1 Tax=Citrifermentans bremense TaxID=60035 RepID=A0A6S6M375_9BACT|nr:DNA-binding protein [Citrifermentans bremense]BCG45825.1 nucleic acid binding, OB-fold, tRNA/helicase-type [Citrifermentans bremense]
MKRYSTIMSVLLTLALPVAGTCADAPQAPEKAEKSKVEAIKESVVKSGHMMMGGAAAAPAAEGAAAAPAPNPDPVGKVLETMDGGGYTYAFIDSAGTKTWVAYPPLETKVGDTLSFKGCLPMGGFQSKALNRKFDNILFCNAPEIAGAKSASAKPAPAKKKAAAGPIKVEKAAGANAYTVEEIFSKRGSLNGKQVVVKGQVVKVASGIMNKNWIHLQDGTGNAGKKTNDLVVTTTDQAEEGDIITVSGTLAKDKDFGGGYKYTAIIEKGSVKK